MPNGLEKMRTLLRFSRLSIVLLLSACNTYNPVIVSVSNHRLDNPEVNSKPLKLNLALGASSKTTLTVEEDSSDDDGAGLHLYAQGSITAGKGVEISIRLDDQSSTHFGIKYQFYGENADKSSPGNFSQAFTLGYDTNNTNDFSECNSSSCTASESTFSWDHDTSIYDGAWILGYKLTEYNIVYGGPFYQWGSLNGYKSSSNGSQEEIDSNGEMIGANLAIEHRFQGGLGLTGEVVYSTLRWNEFSEDSTGVNFKIDYQF